MENHYEDNDLAYKSGVYYIWHTACPQRGYVGSTTGPLRLRWNKHLSLLRCGTHYSFKMQNVVNKYGLEGIRIVCLQFCPPNLVRSIEQYWINLLKPWFNAVLTVGRLPEGGLIRPTRKPVLKYSPEGDFLSEYPSMLKAAQDVKGSVSSLFYNLGGSMLYRGYLWREKKGEDFPEYIDVEIEWKHKNRSKSVCQYSKEGIFIKKFRSGIEVRRSLGIRVSFSLDNPSWKMGGFYWRYTSDVMVDGKILKKINIFNVDTSVLVYSKSGEFLGAYSRKQDVIDKFGIYSFAKVNNFDDPSIKSVLDFVLFRYKEEYPLKINPFRDSRSVCVAVEDDSTGEVRYHNNVLECCKSEGLAPATFYRHVKKNNGGFSFRGKNFKVLNGPYKPVPLFAN